MSHDKENMIANRKIKGPVDKSLSGTSSPAKKLT